MVVRDHAPRGSAADPRSAAPGGVTRLGPAKRQRAGALRPLRIGEHVHAVELDQQRRVADPGDGGLGRDWRAAPRRRWPRAGSSTAPRGEGGRPHPRRTKNVVRVQKRRPARSRDWRWRSRARGGGRARRAPGRRRRPCSPPRGGRRRAASVARRRPRAPAGSNAQATSPAGSSTVKIAPRRSGRFSPAQRPLCSVDDPVRHRQAEAAALARRLGGEERIEQPRQRLGRDSGARVEHLEAHRGAGRRGRAPSARARRPA